MPPRDPSLAVAPFAPEDWPEVAAIYAQGIATGQATFETAVPSFAEWDAAHHPACRLVARHGGRVVGFAALAPVSRREVYRGVAEVSLYVAEGERGRGVGDRLMAAVVASSEEAGFWTLQSSTFPENLPSLKLQERHGFRVLGRRERIARHQGRWRDTLILERRSPRVGGD